MQSQSDLFSQADIIHSYSRAEAIEDGMLVDMTEWASSDKGFIGGFKIPVAVTAAVWADIEAIPKRCRGIQDIRGRAHDVLWMCSLAARRGGSELRFAVKMNVAGTRRQLHVYKAICGPGDDAMPVITIMQPNED